MRQIPHLITLFSVKDGKPFVFWDEESSILFIRHGKTITGFFYIPDSIGFGSPLLYAAGRKEVLIYGSNGRPVASFLPDKNCLIIKRDGEIYAFSIDMRILTYTTIPADQCRDLVNSMEKAINAS